MEHGAPSRLNVRIKCTDADGEIDGQVNRSTTARVCLWTSREPLRSGPAVTIVESNAYWAIQVGMRKARARVMLSSRCRQGVDLMSFSYGAKQHATL